MRNESDLLRFQGNDLNHYTTAALLLHRHGGNNGVTLQKIKKFALRSPHTYFLYSKQQTNLNHTKAVHNLMRKKLSTHDRSFTQYKTQIVMKQFAGLGHLHIFS